MEVKTIREVILYQSAKGLICGRDYTCMHKLGGAQIRTFGTRTRKSCSSPLAHSLDRPPHDLGFNWRPRAISCAARLLCCLSLFSLSSQVKQEDIRPKCRSKKALFKLRSCWLFTVSLNKLNMKPRVGHYMLHVVHKYPKSVFSCQELKDLPS